MAEGQPKRPIGSGMKRRGKKRFKPQKETKKMTEKFTNEGQDTPASEPVLSGQEGNENGGKLEMENGAENFQNLEKSENFEAIVAPGDLEAALEESGEAEKCEGCGDKCPEEDLRETEDMVNLCPKCWQDCVDDPDRHIGEKDDLEAAAEIKPPCADVSYPTVGTQPDGTTKVVVTIQEGYFEAVQQWAEADGVTVESWLSDRLYEYVSTYGEPARAR